MKGNVLKIETLPKNNEWRDKPEVMLHANFQILVDFVEKEKPQTIVDVKTDSSQRKWWKETMSLYRYWKKDRPRMKKELSRLARLSGIKMVSVPPKDPKAPSVEVKFTFKNKSAHNRFSRLEDRLQRLDDEMLQRLINIRHQLWC